MILIQITAVFPTYLPKLCFLPLPLIQQPDSQPSKYKVSQTFFQVNYQKKKQEKQTNNCLGRSLIAACKTNNLLARYQIGHSRICIYNAFIRIILNQYKFPCKSQNKQKIYIFFQVILNSRSWRNRIFLHFQLVLNRSLVFYSCSKPDTNHVIDVITSVATEKQIYGPKLAKKISSG